MNTWNDGLEAAALDIELRIDRERRVAKALAEKFGAFDTPNSTVVWSALQESADSIRVLKTESRDATPAT